MSATKLNVVVAYKPDGTNQFFTINDLPLTEDQKCRVLEWFARKLWVLLEESSGSPHYYGKSYDPLVVENNTAHSYVFDLEDGGRHHAFYDLEHLEKMLLDEGIRRIGALMTIASKEK